MTLSVRPLTISAALAFVEAHHRRLPRLQGGMWAIGAERDGVLLGACVVGRPTARLLDDGRRLQVLRLAVVPGDASDSGQRGICSILYGAAARAARAMGASDLITYIHDDERGVSLRAAGWIPMATTRGGAVEPHQPPAGGDGRARPQSAMGGALKRVLCAGRRHE